MSIDDVMLRPEVYKNHLHEMVFEEAEHVYRGLAMESGDYPVREVLFSGLVLAEIVATKRLQMVEEAIERKDYEDYGMKKDEFQELALRGEIKDFGVNPFIQGEAFEEAMETFMEVSQLFMVSESNEWRFSPLQEVW